MVTDAVWAGVVEAMRVAGERDGKASGSWVADGNTSEAGLRGLLKAWEDGDPAAPGPPSPFSGEWADSPTLRDVVEAETELDAETLSLEEESDLASAYEDAYASAWQGEAERTVCGLLPDEPVGRDGGPLDIQGEDSGLEF